MVNQLFQQLYNDLLPAHERKLVAVHYSVLFDELQVRFPETIDKTIQYKLGDYIEKHYNHVRVVHTPMMLAVRYRKAAEHI